MQESDAPADRFARAIAAIDRENAQDPRIDTHDGLPIPREIFFSKVVGAWVRRLNPNPSEALLLAAHGHHIRRWSLPRSSQPMTRLGYLKWREELKSMHARWMGDILLASGYGHEVISRVQDLVKKSRFPMDPEACCLEDAICLAFLEHQFSDFAGRVDRTKLPGIVRRTWSKMSKQAQALAINLPLPEPDRALLTSCLA